MLKLYTFQLLFGMIDTYGIFYCNLNRINSCICRSSPSEKTEFPEDIKDKITELSIGLRDMKDEFPKIGRKISKNLHQTREELAHNLKISSDVQKNQLNIFAEELKHLTTLNSQALERMTRTIEERLKHYIF